MYVHALHTVHALPDLRVAAGRLRDGVSRLIDQRIRRCFAALVQVQSCFLLAGLKLVKIARTTILHLPS